MFKSSGIFLRKFCDNPNNIFIQLRKKNVGPSKYKSTNKNTERIGNKSKKKLKKRNSAIKNIEPGKPKNTKQFSKEARKSLGHKKLIPLISVINRVLNLLFIASTSRKELVDKRAWLISIQKLASIKEDCPLTTQMVNQCISTTVE